MNFDFNRVISYKNKDIAEINKKYYMFNSINPYLINNLENCVKCTLDHIGEEPDNCFYIDSYNAYSFLYPIEDEKYFERFIIKSDSEGYYAGSTKEPDGSFYFTSDLSNAVLYKNLYEAKQECDTLHKSFKAYVESVEIHIKESNIIDLEHS